MTEDNKEIIKKVNAAFEANNPEGFLDLCTDDIEWKMAGDEPQNGKEAVRKFMASMGDMEPPTINVTKVISEGDSAACYGDMPMVEKGVDTTYSYCDVYRFSGGKIAELHSYVVKQKAKGEEEKSASA